MSNIDKAIDKMFHYLGYTSHHVSEETQKAVFVALKTIETALRDKQTADAGLKVSNSTPLETTTSEGDLLALEALDRLIIGLYDDDMREFNTDSQTIRQALTRPTKDIVDVEEACKAIVFDSMHRSGLNQEPNKWSTADIYEGGRRMYYHLSEQGHLSQPKTEWQDISTAPKDGTTIQLMNTHKIIPTFYSAWWMERESLTDTQSQGVMIGGALYNYAVGGHCWVLNDDDSQLIEEDVDMSKWKWQPLPTIDGGA